MCCDDGFDCLCWITLGLAWFIADRIGKNFFINFLWLGLVIFIFLLFLLSLISPPNDNENSPLNSVRNSSQNSFIQTKRQNESKEPEPYIDEEGTYHER